MEFSFYTSNLDFIFIKIFCIEKFHVDPVEVEVYYFDHNIVTVKVLESKEIRNNVVELFNNMNAIDDVENLFLDQLKIRVTINSLLYDIPNNSNILYNFLGQIYQTIIQNNLNAKHGSESQSTNHIVFQNLKEFTCCYLEEKKLENCQDVWLGLIKFKNKCYNVYLFKSKNQEDVNKFNKKNILFTNSRTFKNQQEYVTNFCRFYYWQYCGKLNVENDLLYFFLFLLAQNSWLCKKSLNRNALKNIIDNPLISIFTGGIIDHLKKSKYESLNQDCMKNNPMLARLLKRPINVGNIENRKRLRVV